MDQLGQVLAGLTQRIADLTAMYGKDAMGSIRLTYHGPDPIFRSWPSLISAPAAREHLEALLWPNGAHCPRCGVTGDRITKLQGKSTRPGVYKCKDCRKPFTVTVGTVMERSHIPLSKWVLAAQLMASSKKGMSAKQLQRMLATNYETAWFLFHRLREAAAALASGPIGGFNKVVEADETYVGGKDRNKHKNKRQGRRGAKGKEPVVVLVERDGSARSFHVPSVTAKTLRPIMQKHADPRSHLMSDEAPIYRTLAKHFEGRHTAVNHSAEEYVRMGGFAHSNTAESFFAILKRGVYGSFHAISEAHLHRYLAEFDWRYNARKVTDSERVAILLKATKGVRLMYQQPRGA